MAFLSQRLHKGCVSFGVRGVAAVAVAPVRRTAHRLVCAPDAAGFQGRRLFANNHHCGGVSILRRPLSACALGTAKPPRRRISRPAVRQKQQFFSQCRRSVCLARGGRPFNPPLSFLRDGCMPGKAMGVAMRPEPANSKSTAAPADRRYFHDGVQCAELSGADSGGWDHGY